MYADNASLPFTAADLAVASGGLKHAYGAVSRGTTYNSPVPVSIGFPLH